MQASILKHGMVLLEQCLTDSFCEDLINIIQDENAKLNLYNHENIGYTKGIQYREKTVLTEHAPEFKKSLTIHLEQIKKAYFEILGVDQNDGINAFTNPIIKKYCINEDDKFLIHYDAGSTAIKRSLTIIWYLRDVEEGGETVFPYLDVEVKPKKGSCLMFPPFWNYVHLARKPLSSDKFTLSCFGHYN